MDHLRSAARSLQNTQSVIDEIVRSLSRINRRTRVFCCIYRDHPALEIALSSTAHQGCLMSVPNLHAAFADSPTMFDRWAVESAQRDRWKGLHVDNVAPKLMAQWGGSVATAERIVLCHFDKPLAYVSFFINDGDRWSQSELRKLRTGYRSMSSALRLAALDWRVRNNPEPLSERLQANCQSVFVFDRNWRLSCTSTNGRDWLRRRPRVSAFIKDVEARGWPGVRRQRIGGLEFSRDSFGSASGRDFHVVRAVRTRTTPSMPSRVQLDELTPREQELCRWVTDGGTNAAIAEQMSVRPSTVKTMLERIYGKLDVRGRVALTRFLISDADDAPRSEFPAAGR